MSNRQARVSSAGAAIFLTPAELQALGVDPAAVDAVEYRVVQSGIHVGRPGQE